jgi:hypothetical protein
MGLSDSSPRRATADRGPADPDPGASDSRRLLVQRVAASRVFSKSARLRDLLVYLCNRVLEGGVDQIHEQEVGHHLFGRPPDYDTTVDNIVRVHASQLRKRLAEFFANEGANEPLVIEIPKGNYAPAFRERTVEQAMAPAVPAPSRWSAPLWLVAGLGAVAVLFASSTAWLLIRPRGPAPGASTNPATSPALHLLWSQVIRADRPTDIVIDDASIGLYQDLTKRRIPLSDYFDRTYLLKLSETAAAGGVDRQTAASVMTRRHASNAAVAPLWKLFQVSEREHGRPSVVFARDYSFRGLKANNVILLGSRQSNPWVEPFESRLGLRWIYDSAVDAVYPVDTWSKDLDRAKFRPAVPSGVREGYCSVSLLSNLGGTGNALLISGTGGSTIATCTEFLTDEQAVSGLYRMLRGDGTRVFPSFEALLRITGRSTKPRDVGIVIARAPRT